MGSVTVEVSGVDAAGWAAQLRAALVAGVGPGGRVSPVEVARDSGLVVAVIGVVFAGVGAAKALRDWWVSARPQGVQVTVVFDDGTRVDVSTADQAQLEIVFQRAASRD